MHVKASTVCVCAHGLSLCVETAIRTPSFREAALDRLALGRKQIKEKVGGGGPRTERKKLLMYSIPL